MMRDIDLIREILLALQEGPENINWRVTETTGRPEEVVAFHSHLLLEAGYIIGADISTRTTAYPQAHPLYLTWAGYELLALAENEANWNRAKVAAQEGGSWAMSVLTAVLQGLATEGAKAAIARGLDPDA